MITTDTARTAAKLPAKRPTSDKPQRRIARPPKDAADTEPFAANVPAAASATTAPAPSARIGSKSASVIALLEREQGATLPEMIEATGWLPHTTRAALTGLRKKGHVITKDKRGDVTCYRITAGA